MRVEVWFAIVAARSSVPPFFRQAVIPVGRAERVVADRRLDLGRDRAPPPHLERIGLGHRGIASMPG